MGGGRGVVCGGEGVIGRVLLHFCGLSVMVQTTKTHKMRFPEWGAPIKQSYLISVVREWIQSILWVFVKFGPPSANPMELTRKNVLCVIQQTLMWIVDCLMTIESMTVKVDGRFDRLKSVRGVVCMIIVCLSRCRLFSLTVSCAVAKLER